MDKKNSSKRVIRFTLVLICGSIGFVHADGNPDLQGQSKWLEVVRAGCSAYDSPQNENTCLKKGIGWVIEKQDLEPETSELVESICRSEKSESSDNKECEEQAFKSACDQREGCNDEVMENLLLNNLPFF